jgi:2-polyprenyl-6-methoxyphenol hydroxylase-like FAD-dependent oxidoreductase
MSPVAGVGINLAVQDAVEAANVLWEPLRQGRVTSADLARVQRRRALPARLVQAAQALLQRFFIQSVLAANRPPRMPWLVRMLLQAPVIRDVPPRLLAFGVGRPHVRVPTRSRAV